MAEILTEKKTGVNSTDGLLNQDEINALLKGVDAGTPLEGKNSSNPFNEILKVDDRSIQKIIREIDSQEIAKALKSTDIEIKNKIFKNMTKRASTMLKENLAYMGPIRLIDLVDAQKKIMSMIMHLANTGEIILPDNFRMPDNPDLTFGDYLASIRLSPPQVSSSDNTFKDIDEFKTYLISRDESEKTYGFSHIAFKEITMCRFFETKGSENILADIEQSNREQGMGNIQIPKTNIKLINYSICPECEHVFSFKDLIAYYANPKPDMIFKNRTEQYREDTRILCSECNTYFLPALVISDGTPKKEVQFLCRVQTSHAIEDFYQRKYGKKILSRKKENHLERKKANGKAARAVLNDVLLKQLSPKPTLISNLLQYTPANLTLNLIDGSNVSKGDVLFGAWQ